jgi:adenylate cyclase
VPTPPPMRPVGRLQLKGKSVPLMVWEPVLGHDADQRAPVAAYTGAYALLAQGQHAQALAALDALAHDWPQDPLVQLHQRHLKQPLTNPALDVLVLQEK